MKKTLGIVTRVVCLLIFTVVPAFSQEAYKFELMWGSLGTGDGQLNLPVGVAVDSSGHVYVADSGNHRIQKFDASGNFIIQWGSPGESFFAQSVAVDLSGNVYVVANETSIKKFDSNGNLITTWEIPLTFHCLGQIAADLLGNVYATTHYCCYLSACPEPTDRFDIRKFDSNGNLIAKWGGWGAGDGQFNDPEGVAVDSLGNVYVADWGNERIQKFDSNGNFITKWDAGPTILPPSKVAVDLSGNMYTIGWFVPPFVGPTNQFRIQKFDPNGNLIAEWGSYGDAYGQFDGPTGISVDFSESVYVADMRNNRIQKFSPANGPQEIISDPNLPIGPSFGVTGAGYNFTTGDSSSTLGHPLEYRFYWGDGTYSNWSVSTSAPKSWSSPGRYTVSAKARCAVDTVVESEWSEALEVTVTVPLPDLVGQWRSLVHRCRNTKSSAKCKVNGKLNIQNVGTLNAASSNVRFYLSDDGIFDEGVDTFLKQVSTGSVKIEKSKMKTLSCSFPVGQTASGKYIIAVIDADNTVLESNESNNYVVFGPIEPPP